MTALHTFTMAKFLSIWWEDDQIYYLTKQPTNNSGGIELWPRAGGSETPILTQGTMGIRSSLCTSDGTNHGLSLVIRKTWTTGNTWYCPRKELWELSSPTSEPKPWLILKFPPNPSCQIVLFCLHVPVMRVHHPLRYPAPSLLGSSAG